ncbi:MAG: hypothetical protein JRI25_27155 [Deltaproteobacteria bacterium]|nr:hypothetical protein [Deltaproteobacteria bacterium]
MRGVVRTGWASPSPPDHPLQVGADVSFTGHRHECGNCGECSFRGRTIELGGDIAWRPRGPLGLRLRGWRTVAFVPTRGICLLIVCGPDGVHRATIVTDGALSLGATVAPPDLVLGSWPHRLRLEAEVAGVMGFCSENTHCGDARVRLEGSTRVALAPQVGLDLTWFPGIDVGVRVGADYRYYLASYDQGADVHLLNVHGELRVQAGIVLALGGGSRE